MLNALSIDVEDYYQVSAAEEFIRYEDWDNYQSRVENNTRKVLDILEEFNVKATFFVLGWVAEKFPGLIKEIHSLGHEIASHGYNHQLIYEQGRFLFREDIRKSKKILEEITQSEIIGYRAPSCSITDKSLWALDILAEEGFKYDSSILPASHFRYGIPQAKRFIHKIDLSGNSSIVEFPLSAVRMFGTNFAICGGGYLRLYPLSLVKWGVNRLNREGYQAMVYFHPWEIDMEQPRIPLRGKAKFKHYVNLATHADKLKRLFSELEFAPINKVLYLQY